MNAVAEQLQTEPAVRDGYRPRATYRLQLSSKFGFAAAEGLLPYLSRLGISDLYLSPVTAARPGSAHGYDVVDHTRLNPELGAAEEFAALAAACRRLKMGIVVDIVPNHMAVMTAANRWWMDVLENGPASRFAGYFDIDWTPARASMRNRLLIPVLGDQLGEVIEKGEISVRFDVVSGSFHLGYYDYVFPIDPREYPRLFVTGQAMLDERFRPEDPARQDLESLLDAFSALPPAQDLSAEVSERRDRDKEVNKRRLARLCEREPAIAAYIVEALSGINGHPGDPDSFDALTELLDAQPYRLAFWRVSGEEINYRRFFDVNELAALKVENQEVFAATHALVIELARRGQIQGVRVDHADGLHDPQAYFERLHHALAQGTGAPPYVVAEKILNAGESLPEEWPIAGTTGYEFGALVTGWLMKESGALLLEKIYRRFTGSATSYEEIVYQSKKRVMRTSLAAEISVLAAQLDRIAQAHRSTTDFTLFDLREAIVEVIACFPVYRTYIASFAISPGDRQTLHRALGGALSRRQSARRAIEFLGAVLAGTLPRDEACSCAALAFTLKFQQVTSPVMAKGVEDTSFYRYPCLLAMNEVGSEPTRRGLSTEILHRENEMRAQRWPGAMLASSTHDTKRGEDDRYRLCVLTEIPELWQSAVRRWRRLKRRLRSVEAATPTHEYLLLQSLLAIWPEHADAVDYPSLRARLEEYAIKAAREAKERTSWLDPDTAYEDALREYIGVLLPEGPTGFIRYFKVPVERAAFHGMLNGLTATVLKCTCPGVPDIYQGNELPQYVLVDPDNRRPVDFMANEILLRDLESLIATRAPGEISSELLAQWHDGRIKLWVTNRLLELRKQQPELFASGDYRALPVEGNLSEHACAYARVTGEGDAAQAVIVIVSRWTATLEKEALMAPLGDVWGDTRAVVPAGIPAGVYEDIFSGNECRVGSGSSIALASQFGRLTVTVLVRKVHPFGKEPAP